MGRHRVRLIRHALKFDAYRSIERFARAPFESDSVLAYTSLLSTANEDNTWDIVSTKAAMLDVDAIISARIGDTPDGKGSGNSGELLEGFNDMSDAERRDLFNSIYEAAGIHVDL